MFDNKISKMKWWSEIYSLLDGDLKDNTQKIANFLPEKIFIRPKNCNLAHDYKSSKLSTDYTF